MNIFDMNGAILIPDAANPKKTYLEYQDVRYIFEEGKYIGWYRPELGRVLD